MLLGCYDNYIRQCLHSSHFYCCVKVAWIAMPLSKLSFTEPVMVAVVNEDNRVMKLFSVNLNEIPLLYREGTG